MSIGTMTATDPVIFAPASTFEAEVNGVTGDLLDSNTTIELGGTLDVQFVDGFTPTAPWGRTVMVGSSITGEFDTLLMPPAVVGLVNRVLNTGTELIVG